MQTGAFSQQQTNTCLQIFYSLQAERETKQRLPILQLKTQQLRLPARPWKRPLQLITSEVDANGGVFTMANKYLSADLLFFTARKGDKATSPSFAAENAAIEASSASLEALIAILLPACGTLKEATFPTAINLLIAVGLLFSCAGGERATSPSSTSIGAYNTLLEARFSLEVQKAFPTYGEYVPSPASERPIMVSS